MREIGESNVAGVTILASASNPAEVILTSTDLGDMKSTIDLLDGHFDEENIRVSVLTATTSDTGKPFAVRYVGNPGKADDGQYKAFIG